MTPLNKPGLTAHPGYGRVRIQEENGFLFSENINDWMKSSRKESKNPNRKRNKSC